MLNHTLISIPKLFGIHWCHLQGVYYYCSFFSTHPKGDFKSAISEWIKALVNRWMPKLVGFKICIWFNVHDIAHGCTFCWPFIIVYQYSETNVMHFLFNFLRSKGLYMFRALVAHPQEAMHEQHLVYWSSTPILVQPTEITRTQYT
jgi:hypothetical protein